MLPLPTSRGSSVARPSDQVPWGREAVLPQAYPGLRTVLHAASLKAAEAEWEAETTVHMVTSSRDKELQSAGSQRCQMTVMTTAS